MPPASPTTTGDRFTGPRTPRRDATRTGCGDGPADVFHRSYDGEFGNPVVMTYVVPAATRTLVRFPMNNRGVPVKSLTGSVPAFVPSLTHNWRSAPARV